LSATDVAESSDVESDADPVVSSSAEPSSQWTVRRVATVLAPALIFLGIRELGLVVLTWMSANAPTDASIARRLGSWDGEWFLSIARFGYDGVPNTLYDAKGFRSGETPMAFFPGYPTLISWVNQAGGWLGIGALASAITVTIVSGVVCAYGLARLGQRISGGSRRAGLALVALFASSPMAIVLSMAYSEALFCAFAVWSLVGVLERRWVLAGVCCAFAGLVRPTAAALILAVGLAVLVAVLQRKDQWRPWIGGVLAPVGLVGYLAWVGARTGKWDGWFQLQQKGWDSGFDGGIATWKFVVNTLADPPSAFELASVGFIAVSVILVVICIVQRVEWPLIVYGVGVLAMDLASNGLMNSKARLMVPAFTLLIPVAVGLAKRRPSTMVIVLCAIAVGSAWFGAYSITSWQFAI
jgi:hypothetical protein